MEISELLKGIKNCECGRDHDCPIEQVIIGKGACEALSGIARSYEKILRQIQRVVDVV